MADLGKLNKDFIAHCKENFVFSPILLRVLDSYRDSNPYLRFFDIYFFYIRNCMLPNAKGVVEAPPKKEKHEELEAYWQGEGDDGGQIVDPVTFGLDVWAHVYKLDLAADATVALTTTGAFKKHGHRKKGAASAQRRNLTYYNILAQFVKHMNRYKVIITDHPEFVVMLFFTFFEENSIAADIPVIDNNLISYLREIDFPEARRLPRPKISNTLIMKFCREIFDKKHDFPPPFPHPQCQHGMRCFQQHPVHRFNFVHPPEWRPRPRPLAPAHITVAERAAIRKGRATGRRGQGGGGKRTKRKKNRRTNPLRTKSRKQTRRKRP